MRTMLILATVAALGVAGVQVTQAQEAKPEGAEVVAGEVIRIDAERNRVTVRTDEGKTYEFEAAEETLRDLEEGDRIEARKQDQAE